MRIESPAEQLFFSTVRIVAEGPDGTATGTGFFFSYQTPQQLGTTRSYPVIVTNKHVVEGAITASFWLTEANESGEPKIGTPFGITLSNFNKAWHAHPSPEIDIAVIHAAYIFEEIEKSGRPVYFTRIPHTRIPTAEQIAELDAIEEVMFIGYPNGMFDSKNLTPIARRGTTATPLQLDYDGLPAFLIDASVFPGSSGSPVFIVNSGGFSSRGRFMTGHRLFLLGVVSAVWTADQYGDVEIVPIPTRVEFRVTTQQMIDLGFVLKSSTIVEAIEDLLIKSGISLT